jgi:predicted TIM-barrel fold metal-dependent hydrolase
VIVDAHVHILPDAVRQNVAAIGRRDRWFGACHADGAAVASVESLLDAMDRHGVDRAVVLGWPFAAMDLCREQNDYIAAAQRTFPDRLVGFGIVNPGDPGACREIDRCADLGLRGIGELNVDAQGFDIDSEEVDDVIAASVITGLPWTIHCSEPLGHEYPGKGTFTPDRLLDLLEENPDLTVIGAHLAGGLPLYAHMPEVAAICRRLYVDTAAQPFLYRPAIYRDLIDLLGVERILFGSDHPLLDLPRYRSAAQEARLSEGEAAAIFGGSAARLFDLT